MNKPLKFLDARSVQRQTYGYLPDVGLKYTMLLGDSCKELAQGCYLLLTLLYFMCYSV